MFQSYKNVGEQRFKIKYSHVNYLKDCISLYKDPIWKYQGEDRHDKLFKKMTELQQKPEQKPHHSGRYYKPVKLGGKDNRTRTENKVHPP